MRDLLLFTILLGSLPFILTRPWLGGLMWVWVSVMSPHRLGWGIAYDQPWAMLIALATMAGMVFSRERGRLPMAPAVVVLLLLFVQMHISLAFALDYTESLASWNRVFKIFFMFFIVLYVLHTKQHVLWLILILTASIAFYGFKGGLFTLRLGGEEKVFGPAGSFIEENNALAIAVIMTIPLLRYWQLQATEFIAFMPVKAMRARLKERWVKLGLLGAMGLCGVSALGSQSRGALLAIAAMLGFLWLKSRSKFVTTLLFILVIPVAIGFMPQKWEDRMRTITTYESDGSAMGRIDAWMGAVRLANDRPLVGGGFGIYDKSVLGRYTPSSNARSAHSIWFQYLGEHGYPGLFLFVLLWLLIWRDASWIILQCDKREGWHWAADLARMIQVSLVGYFVGGALLQLAYYDVPFYLLIAMVLTRKLVEKEVDTEQGKGWYAHRNALAKPVPGPMRPPPRGAVAGPRAPQAPRIGTEQNRAR